MPNTKNEGKLVCPVNTDAVKKYFVKMKKLDKSQTGKGGLGKKRASRWTENPKGRPMQKLETYKKKMIILIGWNPQKRSMQKLRIMTK